jgi:hypothetical protein
MKLKTTNRLGHGEDGISGLEDKIDIYDKTEESIGKRFKSYKRNTQELSDSIKRPNLRTMGSEEAEEVQVKNIHNIFIKIIAEKFPIKKEMPIQEFHHYNTLPNTAIIQH